MKKDVEKQLEAAEMYFNTKFMKISWTARVTNVEVLRRTGVKRCLMKRVKRKQLRFRWHTVRAEEPESDYLFERNDETRSRGRQRTKCMDTVSVTSNLHFDIANHQQNVKCILNSLKSLFHHVEINFVIILSYAYSERKKYLQFQKIL